MKNDDQVDMGFWDGLLTMAGTIEGSEASLADLNGYLLALEEGQAGSLDPADRFPEYATVQLCRSIRRRLQHLCEAGTGE